MEDPGIHKNKCNPTLKKYLFAGQTWNMKPNYELFLFRSWVAKTLGTMWVNSLFMIMKAAKSENNQWGVKPLVFLLISTFHWLAQIFCHQSCS